MLKYKNFVPKQIKAAGFFSDADYENFDHAVDAADAWIARSGHAVIQIETVVLPNMYAPREKGPNDSYIAAPTTEYSNTHWYQFLRVWYRE
jgi:hypothetical protein